MQTGKPNTGAHCPCGHWSEALAPGPSPRRPWGCRGVSPRPSRAPVRELAPGIGSHPLWILSGSTYASLSLRPGLSYSEAPASKSTRLKRERLRHELFPSVTLNLWGRFQGHRTGQGGRRCTGFRGRGTRSSSRWGGGESQRQENPWTVITAVFGNHNLSHQ